MDNIYRELSKEEENKFRHWARTNYHYGDQVNELWHPVIKDECEQMNQEWRDEITVALMDEH